MAERRRSAVVAARVSALLAAQPVLPDDDGEGAPVFGTDSGGAPESAWGSGLGRETGRSRGEPASPVVRSLGAASTPVRSLGWRFAVAPTRRSVIAVGVAALVAAVVTGWWVVSSRPRTVPLSSMPAAAASSTNPLGSGPAITASSTAGGSASPAAADLVVDVEGKVRRPGLYRLASGARVADAIEAAGGSLPHVRTTLLNLAARVSDGQQILVGVGGQPAVGGAAPVPSGTAASGASGQPVSLNNATIDQLQTLPGVGPVLAQHILDWRTAHGTFTSVAQLNDVPGIGDVKFAALRDLVTL